MNGKRGANLICLKRNIEELGFFWKRFWEPGEIHWLFNYRNFGTQLLNELMLSQLMKGCLSEGGGAAAVYSRILITAIPQCYKPILKSLSSFIATELRNWDHVLHLCAGEKEEAGGHGLGVPCCGPTLSHPWCPSLCFVTTQIQSRNWTPFFFFLILRCS